MHRTLLWAKSLFLWISPGQAKKKQPHDPDQIIRLRSRRKGTVTAKTTHPKVVQYRLRFHYTGCGRNELKIVVKSTFSVVETRRLTPVANKERQGRPPKDQIKMYTSLTGDPKSGMVSCGVKKVAVRPK